MSKETFKIFANNHPELSKFVTSGEMSWQKFYEMHDIYGETNEIWNSYINTNSVSSSTTSSDGAMKELINMVKKVDLETVRKGVNGLQKAIGLVQDLGIGNKTQNISNGYEPRPMYKYFDD